MPLVNISNYEESYGRSIQLPKCNREACTTRFAPCYNRGTNTYYCYECARDINTFPAWDGKPLCEIPERSQLHELEELCLGGTQYVGTLKLEDIPELWAGAKERMPKTEWEYGDYDQFLGRHQRRDPVVKTKPATKVYKMPDHHGTYVVYIKTLFDANVASLRAHIMTTPGIVPVEEKRRRPDPRVFLVGVLNDEALAAVKAIEGVTISPRRTYTIS
jgi:hypothetical protein